MKEDKTLAIILLFREPLSRKPLNQPSQRKEEKQIRLQLGRKLGHNFGHGLQRKDRNSSANSK